MSVYFAVLVILLSVGISLQQWPSLHLTPDNENDVCSYFPDGTILRQPGYCDRSIKCENGHYVQATICTGTKPAFDLGKSKAECAAKTTNDYCSAPCVKASPDFVADPKNCFGWYKCSGSTQVSLGDCPANQMFDPVSSTCNYDYKCPGREYGFCDVVPPTVKIFDPDNCHKYFLCVSGTATVNSCDTGLYFDRETGTCIAKAQVDCYKHPTPEAVCGTPKLAIRGKFVSDQATCNGYFVCRDLGSGVPDPDPVWATCPDELFFDFEHQACIDRTGVECNEDRCVDRGNGRTISQIKGCQTYLQCQNNYTVAVKTCENGLYFNDRTQECEQGPISYSICS